MSDNSECYKAWPDVDNYKHEMIIQSVVITLQVFMFIAALILMLIFFKNSTRDFVKLTDNMFQSIYSLQLELDSRGIRNKYIKQMNPIIGSKKTRDLYIKTNKSLQQLTNNDFEIDKVVKIISNTNNYKTSLKALDVKIEDDKNKYAKTASSGVVISTGDITTDYDSEAKKNMKKTTATIIGGSDLLSFGNSLAQIVVATDNQNNSISSNSSTNGSSSSNSGSSSIGISKLKIPNLNELKRNIPQITKPVPIGLKPINQIKVLKPIMPVQNANLNTGIALPPIKKTIKI